MNTFTDYYAVLGIAATADVAEIKVAFKKLALQYHPDVYKGEDAQERMRLLLEAYKTLNDPALRREYDLRRSEHVISDSTPSYAYQQSGYASASSGHAPQGARRDRQRHYAFPDFPPGEVVRVDLTDIVYVLSPLQARTLVQEGMLRGMAPAKEKLYYYCHRCHHSWRGDTSGHDLPRYCPKCQALDWPEYLLLRCLHCCAVFESEQIRNEIGSYSYDREQPAKLCPPYELFPLCPYCGTARWSPTEDARVGELRLRVARRASRLRLLLVVAAFAVLVVVGAVALGMMR